MDRIHFDMKKHHDNNCNGSTIKMISLGESCKRQRPQDDVDDCIQPLKKKVVVREMFDAVAPTRARAPQAKVSAVSLTGISNDNDKSDNTILLCDELLAYSASFLNVGSLKTARLVCKRFNHVLSRNSAGWTEHCHRLWNKRVHVSVKAQELLNMAVLHGEHDARETTATPNTTGSSVIARSKSSENTPSSTAAMEAYRQACYDARLRHVIRPEELVYDVSRSKGSSSIKGSRFDTIWYFRFKESAGREWTQYDPWHNGKGTARRMAFLPNGQVAQVLDNTDESNEVDGERVEPLKLCRPFSEDDENNNDEDTESDDEDEDEDEDHDRAPRGMDIQWRIIKEPMDLPPQKDGGNDDAAAYIRLTVGGRDVPTYIVNRSPTGNWGFLMENCWGVFASFPLPCKRKDTAPSWNAVAAPGLQPPVPQPQPFASSEIASLLQLPIGSDSNNYAGAVTDEEDEDDLFEFLWFDEDFFNEDTETVTGSFNSDGDDKGDGDRDSSKLPRLSQRDHGCSSSSAGTTMTSNASRNTSDLLDDASLAISNHYQWREALLYNLSVTTRLPDGPNALAEWSQAMRRGMSMRTATSVAPHYTYHSYYPQHDYYWSDDDDFEDDEMDYFPLDNPYSPDNGVH